MPTIIKKSNLGWILGYEKGLASPFEKITGENTWLIGPYECDIRTIAIYRDLSISLQYVLLHLAPSHPFEGDEQENLNYSTAGYYRGHYISIQELDDKHAIINGKITALKNPHLRKRNLKNDFLFLAPQTDPFNQEIYRKQIFDVYLELRRSEEIDYRKLQPLKGMMMYSATSLLT